MIAPWSARPVALLGLALGVLLAPGLAGASDVLHPGNLEKGRALYQSCRGCHGPSGYRHAGVDYAAPALGGQHAAYIVSALKAYRDGQRKVPIMRAQASRLSAQEMRDIAAYLAKQSSDGFGKH